MGLQTFRLIVVLLIGPSLCVPSPVIRRLNRGYRRLRGSVVGEVRCESFCPLDPDLLVNLS